MPRYEYQQVKVQDQIETEVKNYDNLGWETLSVIHPLEGGAQWYSLLIRREVPVDDPTGTISYTRMSGSKGAVEPETWGQVSIIENGSPTKFELKVCTQLVRREDPPEIGLDEDFLRWRMIKVWFEVGGKPVGTTVHFPAHEPLDANTAFVAVLKAAMTNG